MVTEQKNKTLLELTQKRDNSEGAKILRMLKDLALSGYTLNINYQETFKAISFYEKDRMIWALENRPKLDTFQKEFLRLLHNYLASVFSLIEHTRAFLKDLNNDTINKYYDEELGKLKLNNCAAFLKDLRVYTQHRHLPFVAATFSFKATNPAKREGISEQKLVLLKKDLIDWNKWSSDSKKYLSQFEKEIDLKKVIEEYQTIINPFYNNFYKKVNEVYSGELEELMKIKSEIFNLQEAMGFFHDDLKINTKPEGN